MATPNAEDEQQRIYKNLEDICEYAATKERFNYLCNVTDSSHELQDGLELEYKAVILKICNHIAMPAEEEKDMDFIFGMLTYSDFILIKDEELQNFYVGVVKTFFNSKILPDIKANLDKLSIPHIRLFLAKALLDTLGLIGIRNNDDMKIMTKEGYKPSVDIDEYQLFTDIKSPKRLIFRPCKFRRIDVYLLNLALRLLNVNDVQIEACHFLFFQLEEIFSDIVLNKLVLHNCSIEIGLLRYFLLNFVEHLKELHITYMIIDTKSLIMLENIALETLMIKNSYFLKEGVYRTGNHPELEIPDFVGLFRNGVLRGSLKKLYLSYNNSVPHSVKSRNPGPIGIQQNFINAETFGLICNMSIEILEIRYFEYGQDNFSFCKICPLTKSLKKLTLYLLLVNPTILSFLALIELEYFSCEVHSSGPAFNLDSFLNDYPEQRAHLKTLKLKMRDRSPDFNEKFIQGLATLNLTEFSLLLEDGWKIFNKILALPNFQKSLIKLSLRNTSMHTDGLAMLLKFEKLEVLEFDFDERMKDKPFKDFIEKMSQIDMRLRAISCPLSNYKICKFIKIASVHCKGFKSSELRIT